MSGEREQITRGAVEAGIRHAEAAMRLLRPERTSAGGSGFEGQETLLERSSRLSHIKGSQDEWRVTVSILASELHTARTISESARARDAEFTLSQIRGQVARFDELTAHRETLRAEEVARESAPVDPWGQQQLPISEEMQK